MVDPSQQDAVIETPDRETGLDRRNLILGAALAACAGMAYAATPKSQSKPLSDAEFEKLIPSQIGSWTSYNSAELILPPPDELSEKLYENIVTRIYQRKDAPPIMFLIAYSSIQRNDVQVHRPEVCYPAAGLPILKNVPGKSKIGNKTLDTRFLIADRRSAKEMILYWTRVGTSFPLDWRDQRIEMARANLNGIMPDGALVRFSMIANDEDEARRTLTDFASEMKAALPGRSRQIFFGGKS
jgi:EpsI family protein